MIQRVLAIKDDDGSGVFDSIGVVEGGIGELLRNAERVLMIKFWRRRIVGK